MRSEEGAAARAPPSERCWNRNPNDTGMPASNWGDGSLCSSVPYTEMPSRWWRDAATSTSGRSSVSGGALESRCSTALESSISPVACAGALAAAIGQASRSTHAHQKRRGEERRGDTVDWYASTTVNGTGQGRAWAEQSRGADADGYGMGGLGLV